MSTESDGRSLSLTPEQLDQMSKEYVARNPDAGPEEQMIHLQNVLGPEEPTLLLAAANEPSLQGDVSSDFEAYRFDHIGERVFPVRCIRLERDAMGCRLVAKICGAGMWDIGPWDILRELPLAATEFDDIAELLRGAGFWCTAYKVAEVASTGWASKRITGRAGDRYHAVARLMELPDGLRDVFRCVERLAGLEESV
jgi:hypothetical protein